MVAGGIQGRAIGTITQKVLRSAVRVPRDSRGRRGRPSGNIPVYDDVPKEQPLSWGLVQGEHLELPTVYIPF